MANYQTISEKDVARGIDARSTENHIPEGYAEDLLNADTNSNGFLSKRPGYQGHYGYFPLRIVAIQHTGTEIIFTVDSSMDIATIGDRPIVVYGKLGAPTLGSPAGDWSTTDAVEYYSTIDTDNTKRTLAASYPSASSITVLESTHTHDTPWLFTQLVDVTGQSDKTNSLFLTEGTQIDVSATTYDVDFDYITPTEITSVPLIQDKQTVAGESYTATTTLGTGTHANAFAITAGTHALSNFNIIVQVYYDNGSSEREKIIPDDVRVTGSSGRVEIDITNSGSSADYYAILTATPITSTKTQDISGSTTDTIEISTTNPYNYVALYKSTSGVLSQAFPDDQTYDDTTDTLTLTVTNSDTSANTYVVYYDPITVVSTAVTVTDNSATSESYTDTSPQLTLWGFDHADVYRTSAAQEGHVNHIDSYRSLAENRMVGGLGGNLFSAQTRSEAGSTYLIPSTSVNIQNRMRSDSIITPLFETTSVYARSRGNITDSSVESNRALVTAVTYVTDTTADFVLSFASAQTLTNKINTDDKFVITGMGHSAWNGTWNFEGTITNDGTTDVTIRLTLSTTIISTMNETGARGRAGCFTGLLDISAAASFSVGDTVVASNLSNTSHTVIATNTSTFTFVDGDVTTGADTIGEVAHGFQTGDRVQLTTTGTLPAGLSLTTTYWVIANTDDTIQLATTYANAIAGTPVDITAAAGGGTHTVESYSIHVDGASESVSFLAGLLFFGQRSSTTIPVDSTANFVVGDMCEVTGYNQKVRVTSVDVSAGTVTFDESITVNDGSTPDTIAPVGRWIPIEAPTSSDDLINSTYIHHFDANTYTAQNTLRSVTVADNMYLTNQDDEVMKFDGTSLYQAGIFRWQPQLFVQLDTTDKSITISNITGTVSGGYDTNRFTIASGEEVQFAVGDTIVHSIDDAVYTVQSVSDGKVYIVGTISGNGTGTIKKTNRYKYYFRLNAIDNNDNVIASAATGASDFIMDLSEAGQIHMRLVGFPAWGIYDYDKLEVEVYRTAADTAAPFYLVRTADIDFNHGEGYIDIVDSTADIFLQDLDPVNTALLGAEIGTAWEQPLRAKYVTTADNRMILANVKDYPELDIVMRKSAKGGSIDTADVTGKIFTFRKDSTSSSTTTDMTNVARYEFVQGGKTVLYTTLASFVDTSLNISTETWTVTDHGLKTGMAITYASSGTYPAIQGGGNIDPGTTYYIIRIDDNDFQLATSFANASAGTNMEFSSNGSANHTITVLSGIATTASNFTVNSVAHGLTAGDWIYLFHTTPATNNELTFSGWWQLASVTTDTFTVDYSGHGLGTSGGTATLDPDSYITATTTTDIPVWVSTDGNYNQVGTDDKNEFNYMQRLANAINASMRMTDTSLTTDFVPWMTANAGSEYGVGRLVIRQPKILPTTLEVVLPAAITDANLFVGGFLKDAADEVSATTKVFPSRVLISYPNYPEIFDAPFAAQTESTSVVDVNSADGQVITGIIPFFGDSVFGGGQAEGVLVVFKENSIYLLDIGSRALTKIQSRGLGCTAPYSIASTRDGIMFANEAGIYRLNRNQSISYVGQYVERVWQDTLNLDQLSGMTGHHYGRGRKYKLSVPVGSALNNSQVLVYDHQREAKDQEFGAWSKYDNHAATGWANLGEDAFFGTTAGQIFSIRNLNEVSDYRDDAAAISMTITYRSMDFGAPGMRKIIAGVNSHFQLRRSGMDGTEMFTAEDMDGSFASAGTFTFTKDTQKAVSALSSLPRRRAQFLQLKYTNSTKDEDVVLSGIDFYVGGLNRFGLPQQNETT